MRCLRTVLVIITTIVVSVSTRIHSQDESNKISPNQFGGRFGAGLNCPIGVDEANQNCEQEARKTWNIVKLEQSTGPQICGYRDYRLKCTEVLNNCKSQKAQVVKSVIEEVVKIEIGLYYDCETLKNKYVPPSAGGDCYPGKNVPKCIKGTSRGVSSTVDHTAKYTFAQHCRNRNSLIKCFSNLVDSCDVALPQNKKAALVRAAQKAYVRFYCDENEGSNFGSGSSAGWGRNYWSGSTPMTITFPSKGTKTKSDWITFTILGTITLLLSLIFSFTGAK